MNKYKFGYGYAFLEKKDIELFEKMALKGYMLVGANVFGFYKFIPSKPEEVSFSVDFTNINRKDDEFEYYIEIFKSSGWNYIFSANKIHFFKAPKGTTPIYTDKSSESVKYMNMVRTLILYTVISLIVFITFRIFTKITTIRVFKIVFSAITGIGLGLAIAMVICIIINFVHALKLKKRNF
ncbi:MAG: DUF2812 domain-containing protein [Oscillospiraceae bacterium]|nr:DUF2812 domain-containing protein [Oscillospiraceae bacterium]